MSIDVFPATVLNATLWNGYSTPLSIAGGGTGAPDAAQARTNLGLGTMAQQNANAVTIMGGTLSGITDLAIADGGTGASTAAQARTNLGLGTMAQQDANAVAITGGSAGFTSGLSASGANTQLDGSTLVVNVTDHRVNINPASGTTPGLDCVPQAYFRSLVYFGSLVSAGYGAVTQITYHKTNSFGIVFKATGADPGSTGPCRFLNVAGTQVGDIMTTATATSYVTSSDTRLKHAVERLVGSLDILRLLHPVSFLWNADDSTGEGLLAHELQQHIPQAVTGKPDALNDDGSINPQGIDYSKLVPRLVGAMQELLAQVETLTARVVALEGARL